MGFGERGGMRQKWLSRGGHPKKKKVGRGDHVKCFSKTLKWHNVLVNEELEKESRRKGNR